VSQADKGLFTKDVLQHLYGESTHLPQKDVFVPSSSLLPYKLFDPPSPKEDVLCEQLLTLDKFDWFQSFIQKRELTVYLNIENIVVGFIVITKARGSFQISNSLSFKDFFF
jgi:hypothetical protein